MKKQRGANVVEFALVCLIFFSVLFAIIEFSWLLFTYETLTEITRRAARLAVVCPIDSTRVDHIKRAAIFSSDPLTVSSGNILDISTADLAITYYDSNFTEPPLNVDGFAGPVASNYESIAFVRAELTGFTIDLALIKPLLYLVSEPTADFQFSPVFSTTLPRESLGRRILNNDNPNLTRLCFEP